ncbi:WD40 repeat-like protein [Imleria badia]|nr:WD40 repeat-like protein [Imleria badia]
MTLTRTQESTRKEIRRQGESKDGKVNAVDIARQTQESSVGENRPDGRDFIFSAPFLVDEKHVVSGGEGGKIRFWRVDNGDEVGMPMDSGDETIFNIAVSRDGKWIVSGSGKSVWGKTGTVESETGESGRVTVWNAESREKVIEWPAHKDFVRAVDVSPDGTRIATGSDDETVCVWSLSTGQLLLDPLQHNSRVGTVKFSPDGHLLAIATWECNHSVRIYNSRTGQLLFNSSVIVNSAFNQSIVWVSDSEKLFFLSNDADIVCLDVTTGATLSQWRIHSNNAPRCLALACDGALIAASTKTSVSFWDTMTHMQIGSVTEHTPIILSMVISANQDIVISGGKKFTIRNLFDIVPFHYFGIVSILASELQCWMFYTVF